MISDLQRTIAEIKARDLPRELRQRFNDTLDERIARAMRRGERLSNSLVRETSKQIVLELARGPA